MRWGLVVVVVVVVLLLLLLLMVVLLWDETAVLAALRAQVRAVEEESRAVRLCCHHGLHRDGAAQSRQSCSGVTNPDSGCHQPVKILLVCRCR